jgi:hypothetical protein
MNQKTTCPKCKQLFEVPGESLDTAVCCPACNHNFNPMRELVTGAWKRTKTPEFQAQLTERLADKNKNLTHAGFAAGVRSKMIGFKYLGEPIDLVKGPRKAIFNLLVMLYVIAPPLLMMGRPAPSCWPFSCDCTRVFAFSPCPC